MQKNKLKKIVGHLLEIGLENWTWLELRAYDRINHRTLWVGQYYANSKWVNNYLCKKLQLDGVIEKGSHFIVINWVTVSQKAAKFACAFYFFCQIKNSVLQDGSERRAYLHMYVYPPADHLRNMQENAFRHTIN